MGVAEILGVLLSVIDKVMDRIPTYEQRKKEKYHTLKKDYYEELQKQPGERDANKLSSLYYELLQFSSDFSKEL